MKAKVFGVQNVSITGDFIKLDALLKYTSLVSTGGEAKMLIQDGKVFVGKEICRARGKKIKPGDVVRYGKSVLLIRHADKDRKDEVF